MRGWFVMAMVLTVGLLAGCTDTGLLTPGVSMATYFPLKVGHTWEYALTATDTTLGVPADSTGTSRVTVSAAMGGTYTLTRTDTVAGKTLTRTCRVVVSGVALGMYWSDGLAGYLVADFAAANVKNGEAAFLFDTDNSMFINQSTFAWQQTGQTLTKTYREDYPYTEVGGGNAQKSWDYTERYRADTGPEYLRHYYSNQTGAGLVVRKYELTLVKFTAGG
jgi:hypothetical protein